MKNKKVGILLLVILTASILLPSALAGVEPKGNGISAGAAKISITPDTNLISYAGVNDDLHARAVVINRKGVNVVLIALDLLGIAVTDMTIPIRNEIEAEYGIDGDYVLIGSTHTHASGVDVIGIYGGSFSTYIVEVYKPSLINKVVEVVGLALDDMRRAAVRVGSIEVDGMTFNRRAYPDTGPQDTELTAMRFIDSDGETIATFVNFASHPVITMTGTLVSADFPGYLCKKLEDDNGGIGIYFNGAQGNINPSMFIKYSSPYASDDPAQYAAAEEYGEDLAEYVETALENGNLFKNLPLEVAKTVVDFPLENPGFIFAMLSGMIDRDVIITPD
ncbi:hypothetical protein LCGC14_3052270, partial [marine sediment metagenome]